MITCRQNPAVAIFEVPDHSFFELSVLPTGFDGKHQQVAKMKWLFGIVPVIVDEKGRSKVPSIKTQSERFLLAEKGGHFFRPNAGEPMKYSTSQQKLELSDGEVLCIRWTH